MKRNRFPLRIAGLAILFALNSPSALTSWGQVVVWKSGQKDFPRAVSNEGADNTDANKKERLLELTATPEPTPALRYLFWKTPALREPGNVNAMMSRAMILYLSHPNRSGLDSQYVELSQRWIEEKVTDDLLRSHVAEQREILATLYEAANLETIEFHPTQRGKKGAEVFRTSISEVQNLRNLARLLQLDAYLAIADKRYDDAMNSIASGFRLAEFSKNRGDANLMTGLVSIAISGITFDLVEQLSNKPDAPNLYWALASLPDELWSQRSSIEGESVSIARILHPLLEPADSRMTESDWLNRLTGAAEAAFVSYSLDGPTIPSSDEVRKNNLIIAELIVGGVILWFSDRASQELIAAGQNAEDIERMSHAEIVARNTKFGFDRLRDNVFKWSLLPSNDRSYLAKQWSSVAVQRSEFVVPASVLLALLAPAQQGAQNASLRISTTHKQLLLHESLRAHAATHNGILPASLVNLEPLPSWPNPATQKLFEYERVSDTEAIVRRDALYPGEKQTDTRIRLRAK